VQVATSGYIPPMADDPQSLVLGHLRAIRADIRDMKLKMDEMAWAQSGILRILASHDERLVRIEGDVDVIKKRLELVVDAV
jgi:hypothetical protein